MNRLLLVGLGAFALSGCVVSSSAAGCDAGPGQPLLDSGTIAGDSGTMAVDAGDAGEPVDAGPIEEEVAHFVNLMDAPVEFRLEGDDAGVVVASYAAATHKNKTGHVTLNRRLIATAQSDAGRLPMTGEVHFDALPQQGRVQSYAVLVVAVGNNLSVVSELDTETEDVRSAATLGSSALALNVGVDLDGDCVADVGAKTGASVTVGYGAHPTTPLCGTTDHFRCVRGKHFTGQLLETGHGHLRAAYWVRTGDTLEVASVVEDTLDSTPRIVLNEQLPWVSVLNLRTTRAPEAVGLGSDSWSASLAPLQVVHLPPAMGEHALQGLKSSRAIGWRPSRWIRRRSVAPGCWPDDPGRDERAESYVRSFVVS